jgi:hypothetical protein
MLIEEVCSMNDGLVKIVQLLSIHYYDHMVVGFTTNCAIGA